MNAIRQGMPLLFLAIGLLAMLLLSSCGGGSSSAENPNPNVGVGWATIDSARADDFNAYLGGIAFISPTWSGCCSGSAVQDTGVTVSWTNTTTGASGQASQHVNYICLFSSCFPSINSWSATIPLAQGANQILIKASDPSSNIGYAPFTIAPGTTYPTVSTTSPAYGETGVGVNESIAVTFSEAMDPATISTATFTLRDNAYNVVNGAFAFSGTTVTFTPAAALVPSSSYSVTISSSVKNLAGNPMFKDYFWPFSTGAAPDVTAPTVSSVEPAIGAIGTSLATAVNARFNEAMKCSTLSTTTFTVKDSANNPVSGTVACSGTTARFTPAAALAPSSTYTATVTTGVKDTAGNALAADNGWSFTTGASLQGTLDATFGTGGVVSGNAGSAAYAIARDATYMYLGGSAGGWRIEKRNLSDGALVSGFGTGGGVTVAVAGYPTAIAIDSTYMYVLGYAVTGTSQSEWRIEKRNLSDGALVAGFGIGGVVTSAQSTAAYLVKGAALALDGTSMYVVGNDYVSFYDGEWRIEKRNLSDGALNTGFGINGVVTSNPSTGSDYPNAIAIDSASMYVAGSDQLAAGTEGRIEKRSLASGALDSGFGVNGIITSNTPSLSYGQIALDASSMYAEHGTRLEKRGLANGALDTGFGTNGVVDTYSGTGMNVAAMLIDGTFIYMAGSDLFSTYECRLEKRNLADGTLVTGFGTSGGATCNPNEGQAAAYALAIDASFIYATGYVLPASGVQQWRTEKRHK